MKRSPDLRRVRVIKLDRLANSVNGNPRFTVTLIDERGNPDWRTTSSDASCSYEMSNYLNRGQLIDVWVTRAGRIEATRPSID